MELGTVEELKHYVYSVLFFVCVNEFLDILQRREFRKKLCFFKVVVGLGESADQGLFAGFSAHADDELCFSFVGDGLGLFGFFGGGSNFSYFLSIGIGDNFFIFIFLVF